MAKRINYTVVYMNADNATALDVLFVSTTRKVKDIITAEDFDSDDNRYDIHGNVITKQYIKFLRDFGICNLEANESVSFYPIPDLDTINAL